MTERELFGYPTLPRWQQTGDRLRIDGRIHCSCICGGSVSAESAKPAHIRAAVREHQLSESHAAWRDRTEP